MGITEAWDCMCAPLCCSNISGASHEGYNVDLLDIIGSFHGNHKLALSHITSFIKVMNESHIIHEDVWMHTFSCILEEKENDWFYNDHVGPITSFVEFLGFFFK
jgi:hypothetical protein